MRYILMTCFVFCMTVAGCSDSNVEHIGRIEKNSEIRIWGENLRRVDFVITEYLEASDNATTASKSYGDWRLRKGKPVVQKVATDAVGLSVSVFTPFGEGAHLELFSNGELVKSVQSNEQDKVTVLEMGKLPVDRMAKFKPYEIEGFAAEVRDQLLNALYDQDFTEIKSTTHFQENVAEHLKAFIKKMVSTHGQMVQSETPVWIYGDRDPSFILEGEVEFGEYKCPLFVGCTGDGEIDVVHFQPAPNEEFIQLESGWQDLLVASTKN